MSTPEMKDLGSQGTEKFQPSPEDPVLSSSDDLVDYQGLDNGAEREIRNLARTFTQRSSLNSKDGLLRTQTTFSEVDGKIPFFQEGTALDPNSDQFDAKLWVKNIKKWHELDADYFRPTSLSMAFRNLRARGLSSDADYQPTVFNGWLKYMEQFVRLFRKEDTSRYFDILKPMDGLLRSGELTVVLGRPGSGCSTFLKTIAANTYGFKISKESEITYDGISMAEILKNYRGNVIYSAEMDDHFPHLTVGQTLEFAASLRTPKNRGDVGRDVYAKHMSEVYMATYGLLQTRNTNVGNDFVRGVSGGERKRVSIAEVSLSGSNVQCWDNATRGLDAATALEFVKALKTSARVLEATPLIAIYQCSTDAYNLFDNAIVMYEGYEIYFGKADKAKEYFEKMGWECPQRQTTADFLTSLTSPAERIARKGFEDKVPKSAEGFYNYWRQSPEYEKLRSDIDSYFEEVKSSKKREEYDLAQRSRKSNHVPSSSAYTVSFFMQVKYLMMRNIWKIQRSPFYTIQSIMSELFMGLVLGSALYNRQNVTSTFYSRGAALFFSLLFNAFLSLLEILSIFESKQIVEKHRNYALYRPSADALASILTELPNKIILSTAFNFPVYFLVNLRRNPGRFFFYWLMVFVATITMSHIFRCLGAIFSSFAGAMTMATSLLLALVIFTGFVIPIPSMLGWCRWINYLNPLGYVFESVMENEFAHRELECDQVIPSGGSYDNVGAYNRGCSAVGSTAGQLEVQGSRYLNLAFLFSNNHKWRNFGISMGFLVFFLLVYLFLTEMIRTGKQKGEVALYLKGTLRRYKKLSKKANAKTNDLESGKKENFQLGDQIEASEELSNEKSADSKIPPNHNIFHWRRLKYDVKIKSETRTLLSYVDGWVKPGQLTALMGSSGAGKTTLLNCLCDRLTSGVISDGVRMVNGRPLDSSFQRSIGYCQQQDLHLASSTVRESLRFSAYLRQPNHVSKKEKDEYVEYVIDLLEMRTYADALVGVTGEGLNVEQRKRLTIGVELAAKPKLLIFLDEPTSGLDSQTAWSVCTLIRKLADHGQAILCTIHQPSAILLQEFDRLLFLQKGGQTVYFGDLGKNCRTLINYFEKYGSAPCPPEANPAEWMLDVVGAAPGSKVTQDYHEVWKKSTEFQEVQKELDYMERELVKLPEDKAPDAHKSYALPFWKQYLIVSQRALEQNWRSPDYIYGKVFLIVTASIFNGFSFFKSRRTPQGLQNQMFSFFMMLIPFNTMVNQMMPRFMGQRDVYEVREAPSKTFSWLAFITAQITSEIPYQVVLGTVSFFCWYYPVGLYENAEATDQVNGRGATVWLFIMAFYVYISTMGHLCGSFSELPENAGNLAVTLFTFCLLFCGVIATPEVFPRFWIFMYRCSPFTYLIQGVLATSLSNTKLSCTDANFVRFNPPSGDTCGQYMESYMKIAGGYLLNNDTTSECAFCPMTETNDYLATINVFWSQRWRNWGIFVSFIGINILLTIALFWFARVPKGNRMKSKKSS
ncbi:uncharacterized protein PRCAT00004256001 [Priceomyces carsonii]|uniref:uncharacterized protein n=1 Tax=Priceomyces carsonii TaxID=28549 RepID=UPI002ED7A948|nr:unnamed protein product [Priceomyces carsonii]